VTATPANAAEAERARADHRDAVRRMFASITPRYDLLNALLSFGRDRSWRRRAVEAARLSPRGRVLDLCCGTGDVAFEVLSRGSFHGHVVGADFCAEMLDAAGKKAAARGFAAGNRTSFVLAEAERLPFPDGSFDAVFIAFGLRNMADLETALAEMLRVTKPGGRCVVLELNTPRSRVWSPLFRFYFHHVSPRIGAWLSGNAGAYRYLPDSVARFANPNALAVMMGHCGWRNCRFEPLSGGIAYLHVAESPSSRAPAKKLAAHLAAA